MPRNARHVLTEWLVLRARDGDAEAFADLHAEWAPTFARMAHSQLRDAHLVDEVVQDTFVQIARGLARLEDPGSFASWAFRILDARCIDRMRRRGREAASAESLPPESRLPPAAPDRPEESDEVTELRAAIARFEPEAQRLLFLCYDACLPLREIAEVLGIPVGTVKSRLFALRERLQDHLERRRR